MFYLFDSTRIYSEISWLFVMIMFLILPFFGGWGPSQNQDLWEESWGTVKETRGFKMA